MSELLLYIAKNLVESPDDVTVMEREDDGKVIFDLYVASDDMGRIIGRHGKVAREIRVLMRSVAQRQGKRVVVNIKDSAEG